MATILRSSAKLGEVRFEAATPGRWADLVGVMEACGYGKKCWCAYWYLPNADFKAGWGDANRKVLEAKVGAGDRPGLIAYVAGQAAGWVGVAPRKDFDRLNRSKNFAALDDLPVWSVNCFIVTRPFRKQGLASLLADAAAEFAFANGAPAAEGYPMVKGEKSDANSLYLGTVSTFERAGYVEVARPLERRAIVRRYNK